MGLGNGNPKYGDKGSNYKYELSVLQLLAQIAAGSSPCCPTDATEATLQQVLAAIQAEKDFEMKVVRDLGNGDLLVRQVITYNQGSGTFNPPIYYDAAGALYVPIGPLEYPDTAGILNAILAAVSTVNRTPGFSSDSVSIMVQPTPIGVVAFSILFRGVAGEFNGVPVPDGYRINYGNGTDPITVPLTYLRPAAGEVFISTLT